MSDHAKATNIPVELLRKYDRPGPRYTSYPTAPMWKDDVGKSQYAAALKAASVRTEQPLAVYCHIPFCRTRCYYCGCNTCATSDQSRKDNYIKRMLAEIDFVAERLDGRKLVGQVHFGGGTPTFIGTDGLGRILTHLDKHFKLVQGCEKSIEIDPRITTEEHLDFLIASGFTRVSLGVQDFDANVQAAIGRQQPFDFVKELLEDCRARQFKGINFDLIYGLPRQSRESFSRTLQQTLQLRPDRLAVYSFAYLPKLRANQAKIKPEELPSTEEKYGLFADAVAVFTGAGYRQIGMDHFALPEDELSEAQADGRLHRNFMGYTVQQAPEMIGLGMSAIGYVNDSFFQNDSELVSYEQAIEKQDCSVYRGLILSGDDLIRQYLITSLMCNFRLKFSDLKEQFGVDYNTLFESEDPQLDEFVSDGLMEKPDGELRVTELGRTFVRNIAMTFDAYLAGPDGNKVTYSRTI